MLTLREIIVKNLIVIKNYRYIVQIKYKQNLILFYNFKKINKCCRLLKFVYIIAFCFYITLRDSMINSFIINKMIL